jgi:hypothetical protein
MYYPLTLIIPFIYIGVKLNFVYRLSCLFSLFCCDQRDERNETNCCIAGTLFPSCFRSVRLHPAYGGIYPLMTRHRSMGELVVSPQTAPIALRDVSFSRVLMEVRHGWPPSRTRCRTRVMVSGDERRRKVLPA